MLKEPAEAISDFHAHIYFDAAEVDLARALAEATAARFGVTIGRFHLDPIGPHPRGSCQLTVPRETFGVLAPWLALNRGELTVFAHPNTGDDLADHARYAIWFGPSEALRLEVFDPASRPTRDTADAGLARRNAGEPGDAARPKAKKPSRIKGKPV